MDYITSVQAAEKWNISQRRVAVLCSQGRIDGAVKAGKTWLIPSLCEKPSDKRLESFGYDIPKSDDMCASEPCNSFLVKTDLMLNSALVQKAKAYYAGLGKTLSEGINEYLKQLSNKTVDYSYTYPTGFFDLFGCAPDLDFPEDIEDLPPEEFNL